jgi:uncharacterized protein (TIGR01244 family)
LGKIAKEHRRALRRRVRSIRDGIAERSPPWAKRTFGPVVDYLDMLFIDHGIFRVIYSNRHKIGKEAWRSSQPAPHQISRLARQGIKTIINLRGERDCGSFRLQQAACARYGIALEELVLKSRAAPVPAQIHEADALFGRIRHPVLMHCKSGADRAGLASVLYQVLREGVPVEEAVKQLHARFGHFRTADTGILDFFFERYVEHNRARPTPFLEWVDTIYDPEALKQDFKASRWANILVNKILRRE